MAVLVAVAFLLFAIFVWRRWTRASGAELKDIPGPKPANDLEGNLGEMRSCGSMHKFLEKYHQQYGPIISLWYGKKKCVSIANAKLFEEHSAIFDRPEELFEFCVPLLTANSIQLANGDDGKRRHAIYSKTFNTSSVKRFNTVFNKVGKDLVKQWSDLPEASYILLQEEMIKVALKSILESMFGEEFATDDRVKIVKEAYDYCWKETERFMVGDIPEPQSARDIEFKAKKKTLDDLILNSITHRKSMFHSGDGRLPVDAVFELDLTKPKATSDLLTLVIGGFHTSAMILTWGIYFLATHQEIQKKVRKEVFNVLGSYDEMTSEMASNMQYMRQVLNETLRACSLGPMAARVHHSDMILGGYKVPAETPVIHALGVSFHDETLFPEPLKFDPDRFSPEKEKEFPPFAFEPFGFAGKRKCPGYKFSYAEATVILSHLLRSFDIELAYEQKVEHVFGFVTKIKDDLWVRATPL